MSCIKTWTAQRYALRIFDIFRARCLHKESCTGVRIVRDTSTGMIFSCFNFFV